MPVLFFSLHRQSVVTRQRSESEPSSCKRVPLTLLIDKCSCFKQPHPDSSHLPTPITETGKAFNRRPLASARWRLVNGKNITTRSGREAACQYHITLQHLDIKSYLFFNNVLPSRLMSITTKNTGAEIRAALQKHVSRHFKACECLNEPIHMLCYAGFMCRDE